MPFGTTRRLLGIQDFVDSAYLKNKRPRIPGGAWPLESLRRKSTSDLQQIWFILVRERNMLSSMREHYLKHTEELGAWPAPSRMRMVEETMANIKRVVKERDFAATDKAVALFRERVKAGIYRFPPGPQPPPGQHVQWSTLKLVVSKRVTEDRVRELFGRFDVFEAHRGISRVELVLPDDVKEKKRLAEEAFDAWRWTVSDIHNYHKWSTPTTAHNDGAAASTNSVPSFFDHSVEVELAPGEYLGFKESAAAAGDGKSTVDAKNISGGGINVHDVSVLERTEEAYIIANDVAVPAPVRREPLSNDPLKRFKQQARTYEESHLSQFAYFPDVAGEVIPKEAPPRPQHPDEIEGPWHVLITYASRDGAQYGKELNVAKFDGVDVLDTTIVDETTKEPYAASCPVYQEAIRKGEADEAFQKNWPHLPKWDERWFKISATHVISHNWANVVDYVEREALLTQKSVWENPIQVDPLCGDATRIPPGATPPPAPLIAKPEL